MAYRITENCRGCQACVRPCPTQAISGERHQVHVIDPGRCIDCGACGRVCPFEAVLTPAAELAGRVKKADWPKPHINHKTCVSCGLCIQICPVSCLAFEYVREGSAARGFPILVQPAACIACGFCANICPVEAITMRAGLPTPASP
ncbi:MAG TPA: 4Fe-4S binding protein [Brevefilum fermentans]|jgi:Na+-translocating ferredoxin:NAD+ oxidoreductase subunit B|nr:4Fe-4S binding protein [Chloroflexota bacterium]HPX96198.1 4Fe-4S binding protein [Brevefilum fermentans]HPX96450.1 4Fe-4S binding protein [Brevefilum fermentans]HQA28161.1 4Fe-4S binding protein [Brevefilum fermentans]